MGGLLSLEGGVGNERLIWKQASQGARVREGTWWEESNLEEKVLSQTRQGKHTMVHVHGAWSSSSELDGRVYIHMDINAQCVCQRIYKAL